MKLRFGALAAHTPTRPMLRNRLPRSRGKGSGRALRMALLAVVTFAAAPGLPLSQAAPETVAVSKQSRWQEAVTWEGRLSTPEADCQSSGLQLAPWGIYPSGSKGIVVWCVSQDVYPKLGAAPWELWAPVHPRGAEGYCMSWHDAGLLHEEPDGRFWCEEPPTQPGRKPGPNSGNA